MNSRKRKLQQREESSPEEKARNHAAFRVFWQQVVVPNGHEDSPEDWLLNWPTFESGYAVGYVDGYDACDGVELR